MEIPA
jgi:hypothetical protein